MRLVVYIGGPLYFSYNYRLCACLRARCSTNGAPCCMSINKMAISHVSVVYSPLCHMSNSKSGHVAHHYVSHVTRHVANVTCRFYKIAMSPCRGSIKGYRPTKLWICFYPLFRCKQAPRYMHAGNSNYLDKCSRVS